MESRLKQDVLNEAEKYGNQVMVTHEDDDYQIVQKWEAVTEVDVQTPLDVYRELEGEPHGCMQHCRLITAWEAVKRATCVTGCRGHCLHHDAQAEVERSSPCW